MVVLQFAVGLVVIERVVELAQVVAELVEQVVGLNSDLFDFLPTDIADILFYCNPNSTDYKTNMRIFYSFQSERMEEIYYKPITPSEKDIKKYFDDMKTWKEREWQTLHYSR